MAVLLFLVCVALFVAVGLVFDHRFTAEWNEQWPKITEEEFLAKCTPGANPEIALKVRRIISDQLCIEYERIHPEMRIVEDLKAD